VRRYVVAFCFAVGLGIWLGLAVAFGPCSEGAGVVTMVLLAGLATALMERM